MSNIQGPSAIEAGTVQPVQNPRLVRAAHEFEAQMMKELFKPLLEDNWAAEGGESGPGAMNALNEFGAERFAQGVSEKGGLGIARSILSHLSHSDTTPI
jgi:hypothetical protein